MEIDGVGSERVAILDAGAQYGKVIDRRSVEVLPVKFMPEKLYLKIIQAMQRTG